MPPYLRKQWFGNDDDKRFEVWAENWPAVQAFSQLQTQWRRDAAGNLAGLDYAAVLAFLTMTRLAPRQHGRRMADLRLMEFGALEAVAEKAK